MYYYCTTTVLRLYYCTTNCTTTESRDPKQLRPRRPQTTKDDQGGGPPATIAGFGCLVFNNQEATLNFKALHVISLARFLNEGVFELSGCTRNVYPWSAFVVQALGFRVYLKVHG